MSNNNNNKKPWIQKKLQEAEQIDEALIFCRNYQGSDEELKKWCAELEKEVLLGMARGITGNASFYDTSFYDANGRRKGFHVGFGKW